MLGYRLRPAVFAIGCSMLASLPSAAAADPQYVALGSSFAAGPGVGARDPESPPSCRRSVANYPHLYAKAHDLTLDDRTCSGATTKDVLQGGQFGLDAQVDAVKTKTELVTITIGGNDVFYLRNLIAQSCVHEPDAAPDYIRSGALCREVPAHDVDAAFATLGQQLRKVAEAVRQRAPDARVVFVNYFTILPASGQPCPALPLTMAEIERGRSVADRLRRVTADVAETTCTDVIDAASLSADHGVCAKDAWLQPFAFSADKNGFAPFAYHPTLAAMKAVLKEMDRTNMQRLRRDACHESK